MSRLRRSQHVPDGPAESEEGDVVHVADLLVVRVDDDVGHLVQLLGGRERAAAAAVGAQPSQPEPAPRPGRRPRAVSTRTDRRRRGTH